MTHELAGTLMQNPYVFIVGCTRSGTTLLRRMVDAHPQIAITFETHWIPVFFEQRTGLTPDGLVTPNLVSELLQYPRFDRLQIGREDLERLIGNGEPVSYASLVSGLFDLYGKARGKALVGDKTPSYVGSLPTLHALWPRARFVHLIRDGRDVALSLIDWREGERIASEDPLSTAALYWEHRVRLGREPGRLLGPDLYCELRYEALVADPAEACAALCEFLGVPYDEAMLRFHEGRTRTKPGLSAKKAWLPITAGLRDWRSQMSTEDVERFEAVAGDLLDELGYPLAAPRPTAEAVEHAARMRSLFSDDVSARGWRLPQRW